MQHERLRSTTATIDIYIKLAPYPMLADKIRERMREELFARGVITKAAFEEEVEQLAKESQKRERMAEPFRSESESEWEERKRRIRNLHTDFYFAYNLPTALFERLIRETLMEQPDQENRPELVFNPEIAPWSMLFKQGTIYEELATAEQKEVAHHLEEIKVVLIKGMISDQLQYVGIAKNVFSIADLRRIYERRIGGGKIGGKAGGMVLAWKILQGRFASGPDISDQVHIPESHYLGTDVLYEFHSLNRLTPYMNQKYRPLDEIRSQYPKIVEEHLAGHFPQGIEDELRALLVEYEGSPLIVRSSSLLEDNFGHAFAGKYQSHFCPNQGTEEENLAALLRAIKMIYASALNPDALLYRKRHNLLDYDERMAVLIQPVRGQRHGRYLFPAAAGVGFSKNPFRWSADIRREDGFLRLVWGIGTRAVDRVSDDYPRMIALSHPERRPETSASAVQRYSQHFMDVIDLEANELKTVPIHEVLDTDYPYLRQITSLRQGDEIRPLLSPGILEGTRHLIITFDELVRDKQFIELLRTVLARLEQVYQTPVDIEFTVDIQPGYPQPAYELHILQCRPLSERIDEAVTIPTQLPQEQVLFTTYELIPDGRAAGIRYIVFVDPRHYRTIADPTTRLEIGRAVGRLNKRLEDEAFILMGPGRWGSANLELGVRVGYADIYNTKVLIEMAVADDDVAPELSYGTHFFQDLVEGGIHSLPLHLQNPRSQFNWEFFEEADNVLQKLLPADADLAPHLKVIDLEREHPGQRLTILMDGSRDEAVAYLGDS